jgi:class 3 adenylate cyclase/predicted ATPase
MRCPSCQAENREGRRFCAGCGAALALACPDCGFANEPDEKFCGGCGAALASTGTPAAAEAAQVASPEAERRQLTVMFCDLVGSTGLSERLDPEDLREVLRAYQKTCAEAVGRYDGYIAKYIGDGLLIYFGYPQAHEDDAARAVRAGLDVIAGIERLARDLRAEKDLELAVRLGIHTGLVVVGEMGAGAAREDMAIVGETPNVAARLEAMAEPNSVLIGARTYALVEGLFVCEGLGAQRLKGISEPLPVYRVCAESRATSRFEASVERGLTPLVGRAEEIGLLLKRWEQAKEGEGQVVLLSGEPGVGKSRILRGFRERLEAEPHSRVLYYCSPYHQNSAFHPVIDQMERALRLQKDDDAAAKLDKLDAVLSDLELPKADLGFLLASLLSVPADDRYRDPALGPEQTKKRTTEAAIRIITAMARRQPVLMVVEDAHWLDPTTQEFLSLAVDQIASSRVLLFLTHRPEFEPPWHAKSHVTALALNRLSRRDSAAMIGELTGGKGLPEEVLEQILAKTDGVPLFTEELTKAVLESGLLEEAGERYTLTGPLPPLAIPASLQDSLMARLDRLAPVKEVAQLAAMLGRVFSRDLLAAVSPLDEGALDDALSRLVEAGLIYRHGIGAGESYEFKHALVQDAAYQSLLKSTRQRYHRRIAEVLEQRWPETAETEPELLAHHYTEARLIEPAIAYWRKAGERAGQRSAHQEAIAQLTKALNLLETLPQTPERDREELALNIALGPALMATKGWPAPESERVYRRGRELAQRVGKPLELFTTTWGLWLVRQQASRLDSAQELAGEILALAHENRDPAFQLQAHHAAWTTVYRLADFRSCLDHTEQGIALYDIGQFDSHAFSYGGHDPGVCARFHNALTHWSLGYPDRALDRIRDAEGLAEKLAHPFSLALARFYIAVMYQFRRDAALSQRYAEAAMAIAAENDFLQLGAQGLVLRGWAIAAQGQIEQGIAEIRQGLQSSHPGKTGTGARRPYFHCLLAECYGRAGQGEPGLRALAEAIGDIEKTGERTWEAEIHRVKGELLASQRSDGRAEAEACFKRALEISRQQGAKSAELRAATALARLRRDQGETAEAGELLAPIAEWFTEGLEIADLRDAKALLDELG